MDNFLEMNITYATLETALLSLGFELTLAEPHRLYYHAVADSIFGIPFNLPLAQRVRQAHLSSARHAVVAMGITDEATFEENLLKSASADLSAPTPARYSAPRHPSASKRAASVSTFEAK